MKLNLTRRDVLKFGGGAAVGVALTPAPWKTLDDVAIWSQNWSWIPRPPQGPSSIHDTTCALCTAGCAAQARCIGTLPVSMRTANEAAPLCPLGLTAHHLPYHPARIARSFRVIRAEDGIRRIPVPLDTVISAAVTAMAGARGTTASVAVLDTRPGRSTSWAWQRLLGGIPNGIYIPAPGREGANLTSLREIIGSGDAIGFDLENVRTILSFRAPIASGWGSRRMNEAIRDGKVRLIQVDAVRTQTADIAQRWLPAKPGSEAALAYGIANVLMSGNAATPDSTYASYTAEAVAAISGVPGDAIVATARELAENGPALVVMDEGFGRQTEDAIHGLNVMLRNAAIVPRAELPAPYADATLAPVAEMDRVPDGSIAALIVDASAGDVRFPWPVVRRKLRKDAVVIAIAPFFAASVQRADYVVPALTALETISELPTPFDAPAARLSIAPALLAPRHEAVDPAAFVRAIARAAHLELPGDWSKSEELTRARVAAIHSDRIGSVTARDGSSKKVTEFASADELWDALTKGGVWNGDTAARSFRAKPRPAISNMKTSPPLVALVRTPRDVTASAAVSPVMTKLYQESGLRRPVHAATVNPVTANQLKLANGAKATLRTEAGAAGVVIVTDHAVMPGVVEVTAAPDAIALGEPANGSGAGIIDLFAPDANGAWRIAAARLVEA